MNPKIGEPRIYDGEPEVLYPGEWAHVDSEGRSTVSPEPGLAAAWLRLRYRLVGQWIERLNKRRQRHV